MWPRVGCHEDHAVKKLCCARAFWAGLGWFWVVLGAGLACAQHVRAASFQSAGRSVQYEVFAQAGSKGPVLILLLGTSGPQSPFYRSEAAFYAKQGYSTLLLHYFDAFGSQVPGEDSYQAWAKALTDLVAACKGMPEFQGRNIFVLGYSLGASVALAAGSQDLAVQGIAEWYGSLPNSFFGRLDSMPPLLILHGARDSNIPVLSAQQLTRLCASEHFDCKTHLYPEEGHSFGAAALRDAEQRTLAFFQAHTGQSGEKGTTSTHP